MSENKKEIGIKSRKSRHMAFFKDDDKESELIYNIDKLEFDSVYMGTLYILNI